MASGYFWLPLGILLTISQNMVSAKPIDDTSMDICTWETFKNYSWELNTLVMTLHAMSKHESHPKVYIKEDKGISRIQCQHQCNPEMLLKDKKNKDEIAGDPEYRMLYDLIEQQFLNLVFKAHLTAQSFGFTLHMQPFSVFVNELLVLRARSRKGTCRQLEETCLKRIYEVLYSYENHIIHVFGDKSISKDSDILLKINGMENHLRAIAHNVNPQIVNIISNITKKMDKIRKCLEKKGYKAENVNFAPMTAPPLITSLLIEHTSYRLMSFTSLVARVFAVGDPSNHMLSQK